jgi:predicted outer membrane repeat protein
VYLWGAPKQALFTADIFEDNQSGGCGGALAMDDVDAAVEMRHGEFRNNRARGGALAMDDVDAAVEMRHGEFRNNRALWGGALSLYGSSQHPALAASALTFKGNSADAMGGAVYVKGATLQLGRGIFVDNSAPKGGVLESDQSSTPPAVLANLLMGEIRGWRRFRAQREPWSTLRSPEIRPSACC